MILCHFLKKYKLKLRIFDMFYTCIYKYDPPIENNTNKAMYVMTDGDHIYTLDHDISQLRQKMDTETNEKPVLTANHDYYIKHIEELKEKKRD